MTNDRHIAFGSASRTITLGLGYWAMIAQIQEKEKSEFKDTIQTCIKIAHRDLMSKKRN